MVLVSEIDNAYKSFFKKEGQKSSYVIILQYLDI